MHRFDGKCCGFNSFFLGYNLNDERPRVFVRLCLYPDLRSVRVCRRFPLEEPVKSCHGNQAIPVV